MIDRYLKAKHWQIFLVLIILPLILQLIIMFFISTNIGNEQNRNTELGLVIMIAFPLILVIFLLIFFGWFWAIAIGLQKKVPNGIEMKTRKFKIFFFVPIIYISILIIYMAGSLSGYLKPEVDSDIGFAAVVIPLHLFSMFCIFYVMYFAAKTIKTVDLQRETHVGDYIGEFFLFWFYFIGIWLIQPKVNKLIE